MKKEQMTWIHLKRAAKFLLDVFEVYIPAIAFLIIFAVFIVQIFSRYVLKAPLTWSFDITMTLYVYAIMFGACYTLRENDHICFSMLYDSVGPRMQMVMRLGGNLLVILIFVLAFPSCYHYSWTIITAQIKKTSVLFIPYKYLYIPMMFLMTDSIVRLTLGVVRDVKSLKAGGKGESL